MRTILAIIFLMQPINTYAQNNIRFNAMPLAPSNTLNTSYTQTRWYYQHIIEQGYDPSELAISSQQSLKAILDIQPTKNSTSKSILDVYKEYDNTIKKHQLNSR